MSVNKIEFASLPIIAKWHRDQTKLFKSMGRDARAESNVKYCADMAYLHERWAQAIEQAYQQLNEQHEKKQ